MKIFVCLLRNTFEDITLKNGLLFSVSFRSILLSEIFGFWSKSLNFLSVTACLRGDASLMGLDLWAAPYLLIIYWDVDFNIRPGLLSAKIFFSIYFLVNSYSFLLSLDVWVSFWIDTVLWDSSIIWLFGCFLFKWSINSLLETLVIKNKDQLLFICSSTFGNLLIVESRAVFSILISTLFALRHLTVHDRTLKSSCRISWYPKTSRSLKMHTLIYSTLLTFCLKEFIWLCCLNF